MNRDTGHSVKKFPRAPHIWNLKRCLQPQQLQSSIASVSTINQVMEWQGTAATINPQECHGMPEIARSLSSISDRQSCSTNLTA